MALTLFKLTWVIVLHIIQKCLYKIKILAVQKYFVISPKKLQTYLLE